MLFNKITIKGYRGFGEERDILLAKTDGEPVRMANSLIQK